jgi:hypothetical protein
VIIGTPDAADARAHRSPAPVVPSTRPTHPVAPQPRAATPPHAPRAVERVAQGVFGSDLITERSLDEVILSYLAEDVESSDE